MCAPRRFIAALLILVGVMLSACDEPSVMFATPTPTPCDVDFRDLVPTGWVPIKTFVIKTGGLGPESQCAVVYRLDAQKDPQKVAPFEAVVYRRDHGEPPRSILAYPLRLPERFYLGEHNVNVKVPTDTLITGTEWPQVVVEDWDPDGIIVEASLFQWYDLEYKNPFAPYDPNKMNYKLVGWFMGEGGVTVEQNRVTVRERIAGSRSRLANRKIYVPHNQTKTYYKPNSDKLVDPETDLIALVECTDPNAACYPERTVLAFYQAFQDNSALEGLMKPEALEALKDGKLKYGCASNRADVERALVQDITIQDAQSRVTVTKGQCKSKEGRLTAMPRVVWTLERNKEGKWLLNKSQ
jgi:hypothetical protein